MRCSLCGGSIHHSDDFCPNCGALFGEDVCCERHPHQEARGVCVICSKAYCESCGGWVSGIFLCNEHHEYEIVEGMARVFGASDSAQVEFAKSCLERDGLHPFIFSRKASPISMGSPDYSLFRASGEFDGHIINEYKLMVPIREVRNAQQVLKKLHFVEGKEKELKSMENQ